LSRIRTSLVLLALCVGAIIVSWIQVTRESERLPAGSSYSFQNDGLEGLYQWAQAVGAQPVRLRQPAIDPNSPPRTLVVVQAEDIPADRDRDVLDIVPAAGGTLVLAGDSLPQQIYARALGISLQPASVSSSATTSEGVSLPIPSRLRLRGGDLQPLLTSENGDIIAAKRPYLKGTLLVLATSQPLSNVGLRDPRIARFVYQQILAPVGSAGIAFDEVHHSYAPPDIEQPARLDQLVWGTAPGRAIVYGAALIFFYLLVSARRLGPPLVEPSASETRRTMYEHVQMLASLYRRAGQVATVRTSLERHYQRLLARGTLPPAQSAALGDALIQIHDAGSEHDLIAAVAAAENAVTPA
jgi:hypothetical protein